MRFLYVSRSSSHLTNELTGAGARRAQGTNSGHKNAEGMAAVGVHVELTVRLGREATVFIARWLAICDAALHVTIRV